MRLRTVQGDRYIKLLASALMIVCAVSFAQTAPLSASVAAQSDSRNVGPVFKTTDGGASWAAINSGITAMFVSALAIDPKSTNTLYAGTDRGIFKSTNGGATWTSVGNTALTRAGVTQLEVDPRDSSTLYAATGEGLLKSTDGGRDWTNTGLTVSSPFLGSSSVITLAIDPVNPSIIYAGTGGGVSQNDSPWITSVSISGKRLLLTGEAFDDGATILLDGIPQKTVNDAESPTSRLIGNKAGKKVKKNPDLRIQVRNANGRLSQTVLRSVD